MVLMCVLSYRNADKEDLTTPASQMVVILKQKKDLHASSCIEKLISTCQHVLVTFCCGNKLTRILLQVLLYLLVNFERVHF